jgi:hypothetical protein
MQRVGQDQQITDPTLPPGTSSELIAMFRTLEGSVEIDPAVPLIAGGSLTVESRLHARLQLPGSAREPIEQMFEDTGKISFARCRPLTTRRAPAPAPPRRPAAAVALAACPDGFAPR